MAYYKVAGKICRTPYPSADKAYFFDFCGQKGKKVWKNMRLADASVTDMFHLNSFPQFTVRKMP